MNAQMITFLLGQAFGIIALIFTVVSMQLHRKKAVMVTQTCSEVFIILQYWVKGAFTGSAMAILSFTRDLIFTRHDKERTSAWVLAALYVAMTLVTVLTWKGWLSLLPFSGSLIYTYTIWYGNVRWIKFGNAVGNTPYLLYTYLTGNFALFIMTLLEVIAAWVGFFRPAKGKVPAKKRK